MPPMGGETPGDPAPIQDRSERPNLSMALPVASLSNALTGQPARHALGSGTSGRQELPLLIRCHHVAINTS